MHRTVLVVTAIAGAEKIAEALSSGADASVEVVPSRRAALARLRRAEFRAIVVDAALSPSETTTNDILWQNAGPAVPVEVNLAVLGVLGLVRMIRSIVDGVQAAEARARDFTRGELISELRSPLTGLLLQSELMLRQVEADGAGHQAAGLRDGLRELYQIAEDIRTRLGMQQTTLRKTCVEKTATRSAAEQRPSSSMLRVPRRHPGCSA